MVPRWEREPGGYEASFLLCVAYVHVKVRGEIVFRRKKRGSIPEFAQFLKPNVTLSWRLILGKYRRTNSGSWLNPIKIHRLNMQHQNFN